MDGGIHDLSLDATDSIQFMKGVLDPLVELDGGEAAGIFGRRTPRGFGPVDVAREAVGGARRGVRVLSGVAFFAG